MGVFDNHSGMEAGDHVAAGGHVIVFDFVIQRNVERVAVGEFVHIEGVLSVEIRHVIAVGHGLILCRNGDVAKIDGQAAEFVVDFVVARDDIAFRVVNVGGGGDDIFVFASLDMVGIRVVAGIDVQAEADIDHVATHERAVIERVGESGVLVTVGHRLVISLDDNVHWRDGRRCRVDEDGIREGDIIVL